MVRKSNESIDVGSANKLSEEVKMTDLVLPDLTVSGNYCMLNFFILSILSSKFIFSNLF